MKAAPKVIALLLVVGGIVVVVAGVATWVVITNSLAAERITVTDDAPCAQGEPVDGPISAYCMTEIINTHALESTGGKTYAELDREDPLRATAMQSSFLRASLFTSVVAYGVAAFAAGMGVVMILTGIALRALDRRTAVDARAGAVTPT
jgi:hypothetical protein